MTSAKDVFVRCDELENLPPGNRTNYLFELEWLATEIPRDCAILQVGSMDGMRARRLLEVRPDLHITGLEIEGELIELASTNAKDYASQSLFVQGDITKPPTALGTYAYVICLNNTLGYIPDTNSAITEMKRLGHAVVVSVYGEKFTDDLARQYFQSIGLEIHEVSGDVVVLKDFSSVRRFPRAVVDAWRPEIVVETPIGYLATLPGVA